jgi:hypothetical protein
VGLLFEQLPRQRTKFRIVPTPRGREIRDLISALFARHADGLISKNVIDFNTLEDMSSTLRRMERYWTDQIRYIY